MDFDLAGKVVFITGSSRGIGRVIAEYFCREQCVVICNSRHPDELEKSIHGLNGAVGISGDVTDPKQAQKIIDQIKSSFGKLDILVCNVGSGRSVPAGAENYAEWQRVFAINFLSCTNIIEACSAFSLSSVICISSICGVQVIDGAPLTYSVAKAALNAYVKGISRPLGKKKTRINAIACGNILFDESVWHHKISQNPQAVQEMLDKEVSLSRLGTPDDIAKLVLYLASHHSSFATGSIWTLDGGQVRV